MGCSWSGERDWPDAVPVEDCAKWMRTGDLVLFCGTGFFSMVIRLTSLAADWSHVGMVVVVNGELYITEANKDAVGVDAFTGEEHDGVQCVPLLKRLKSYDGSMAWVPVRGVGETPVSQVAEHKLISTYQELQRQGHLPKYNLHLDDLWEYATRTDDDNNMHDGKHEEVCVTWVAHCYKIMGHYRGNCGDLLLSDVAFGKMPLVGLTPGRLQHLRC
jgi:hypothetical protein